MQKDGVMSNSLYFKKSNELIRLFYLAQNGLFIEWQERLERWRVFRSTHWKKGMFVQVLLRLKKGAIMQALR